MKTSEFYFDLPPELIAQYPLPRRSGSRLLTYYRATNNCQHHSFSAIANLLNPGDLLVMNNSKVIPARLFGVKETGGKVELLIERLLDNNSFLAHIRASKAPKANSVLQLANNWRIQIIEKINDLYHCSVFGEVDAMLQQIGHVPLPQYINRSDEQADSERYQTIYALHKGSVAAPTAGLHFDEEVFSQLQTKGVNIAYVTLHVGAGTFRPVRTVSIKDHQMHSEQFIVSEELSQAVKTAKAKGKRVIAVGTTALRSLESAAVDGMVQACQGDTDIFIYPGYQFQVCDGLLTNFHLPESTLLMLVAAFIGHDNAMAMYQEAIAQKYRFYSYGDASLLL